MCTRGKPRKPPAGNDEDLSVSRLASIPLKRRLEILFASNIIPCRRQLAIKYELSEQLIHNVLSHRKYLLENWKYNADAKSLFSKMELENAMAMTELLIEWKRRVQLNGLQITDTALTRKAVYLQRVLNGFSGSISDEWWDKFDINWLYKRFQDYESDSLEIEDILNDLQWMFSEITFRRLISSFRKAKHNNRMFGVGDVNRVDTSTSNTDDYDDCEEYYDISDINTDPDYYNDDDFDCEDYEFVLDEEVVIDALRKELEDSEQAKYQQYLLGGTGNDSVSQEEVSLTDALIEEENYNNDDDPGADDGDAEVFSDGVEKLNSKFQQTSSVIADLPDKMIIKSEESPGPLPISSNSATSVTLETQPTQQTQPKRKPRNLHAVLSLRKDYVRMPAPVEIAQLARSECLEQLLRETDESDEDFDAKQQQKKHKRKKYASPKSKSTNRRSYKPRAKILTLNSNATRSSPEDFTSELIEIQKSQTDTQLDFGTYAATSEHEFNYDSFDDVKEEIPSPIETDHEEFIIEDYQITGKTKEANVDFNELTNHEQNNNNFDKIAESQVSVVTNVPNRNARRSNRITAKVTEKLSSELDSETILGGPLSYDEVLNVKAKPEFDIEEEIAGTAIQTTDGNDDSNKQRPEKRRIAKIRKLSKKSTRLSKSPLKQENVTPNANKRAKRRTDGSDLTLRKDKVRLSLVRLVSEKDVENFPGENAAIDTDVQMVFEPYIGED